MAKWSPYLYHASFASANLGSRTFNTVPRAIPAIVYFPVNASTPVKAPTLPIPGWLRLNKLHNKMCENDQVNLNDTKFLENESRATFFFPLLAPNLAPRGPPCNAFNVFRALGCPGENMAPKSPPRTPGIHDYIFTIPMSV